MDDQASSMRRSLEWVGIVTLVALAFVLPTGCGSSGDPYSGVWTPSDGRFTFRIEKADNAGWLVWEVGPGPEKILSWEVDRELKTGSAVFRRSGDQLVFISLPGAPPVYLTRQAAATASGSP